MNTNKTSEVPKSGWKNINSQGTRTIKKGDSRSFIEEIDFFSSTKARVNIVLNFATSEGWNEKIPKLSHLWAP